MCPCRLAPTRPLVSREDAAEIASEGGGAGGGKGRNVGSNVQEGGERSHAIGRQKVLVGRGRLMLSIDSTSVCFASCVLRDGRHPDLTVSLLYAILLGL